MRHWHRQFLGRTQLPPTLSALTIGEFFTLDGAEIRTVLSRDGDAARVVPAILVLSVEALRGKQRDDNASISTRPFQRAHFKAEVPWAHLAHPFLLRAA